MSMAVEFKNGEVIVSRDVMAYDQMSGQEVETTEYIRFSLRQAERL